MTAIYAATQSKEIPSSKASGLRLVHESKLLFPPNLPTMFFLIKIPSRFKAGADQRHGWEKPFASAHNAYIVYEVVVEMLTSNSGP